MKENEKKFSPIDERLSFQFANEKEKEIQTEEVRQKLIQHASQEVEKYKDWINSISIFAETRIIEAVQPWFTELIKSGTYDKTIEWVNSEKFKINLARLSNSILYLWPKDALNELGSQNPYKSTAKFIVDYGGYLEDEPLEERIKRHAHNNEVWRASFLLNQNRKDRKVGVHISRWPGLGGGFAFAMGSAGRLEIPFSKSELLNLKKSRTKISPEVWIDFADQIESGEALEVFEKSLQPRIPQPARSSTEYYAEQRVKVNEYLERKGLV